MKQTFNKKRVGILVILANIVGIALLGWVFYSYHHSYQKNLYNQNITNIQNLNESSLELSTKYFDNGDMTLLDLAYYAELHPMNLEELKQFLLEINNNQTAFFELIGSDYTGWLISSQNEDPMIPIRYTSRDYSSLHKIFDSASQEHTKQVLFAPEFTDDCTIVRSFAQTVSIRVEDEQGTQYYTLATVFPSEDFIQMIQMKGSYQSLSTVLFDSSGDYIISGSSDFKSDNLFQYIATYNNMNLDQKTELANEVTATDYGTLTYKNSSGQDSVFVYQKCPEHSWYIVTSVPLASFSTSVNNYQITIYSIIVLLCVFAIDFLWLRKMNFDLETSMEMEKKANSAKTDFLSRMSHDMRTPMNGILGLATLMKDKADSPQLQADLSQIQLSGKYLLNLINDTLDMAKIESGKLELHPKPANTYAIISNVISNANIMAMEKNITLTTNLPDTVPTSEWKNVYIDASRFEQILMNLISNAVKYTPPNGAVSFTVENISITDQEIQDRFIIEDNGIGMSKEFLPHVFEAFQQEGRMNNTRGGGSGLGMSIVKQLVDAMGGSIQVESEINQGTRFTVEMRYPISNEAPETAEQITDFHSLKGMRVLICEDNVLNREIAVRLLSKYEIRCDTAEDGSIGVEKMKNATTPYETILMDIRMPIMNGLDATRAIRALHVLNSDTIPIIAMTANAFEDDVEACMNAGMNDHIAKPFDPQRLLKTLVTSRIVNASKQSL